MKSGSDFRQLSKIVLTRKADKSLDVNIERVDINEEYEEDPEVKAIVDDYISLFHSSYLSN